MFKKFSLKIRINVICIVCVMLAIQFSLTYILFFSIFTEDFKQKSNDLGNQIADHVSLRLQFVEEAARLFCNESDIHTALETFDSSMAGDLRNLIAATNDIRGCFISGKRLSYYYSSDYNRLFSRFGDYVLPRFDQSGKSGYWCIYSPAADREGNYLIYSHVIRDEHQKPVGVLSIDVSIENLYNATEMFDADIMKYTTVYISSHTSDKKLFFRESDEMKSSQKGAKTQLESAYYADDIYINAASSFEYIQTRLRFVLVLMITIFAFTLVLLFIILYAYSKHLVRRMTGLVHKMNNFTNSDTPQKEVADNDTL